MAPAATIRTEVSNGHADAAKKSNGTAQSKKGEIHLTSADVIHLEHEYGAHK